jgi:hypothetical protein
VCTGAGAHGWQESNLRHPVLETGALTELSYTHEKIVGGKRKRRLVAGFAEAASVAFVARLRSPPVRVVYLLAGQIGSGRDEQHRTTARHPPLRFDPGVPQHRDISLI